jgi:hypothetical protein
VAPVERQRGCGRRKIGPTEHEIDHLLDGDLSRQLAGISHGSPWLKPFGAMTTKNLQRSGISAIGIGEASSVLLTSRRKRINDSGHW